MKPERDANQRDAYRVYWWRFGEPGREWRAASAGLSRYIATAETSKHRFFVFLDAEIAPDNSVIAIASDDAYVLGVLSSRIHQEWALAAGGRMGVRDTPRYNKGLCFDPFPFAEPSGSIRLRIADAAMRLESHRNKALVASESVTMMKMYDVVEALRAGRPLKASEQAIHVTAACGVVKDLHDELDALVAEAYGWPWPMEREEILDRLVQLHDERVQEEKQGSVRWLRPGYQMPRFGQGVEHVGGDLGFTAVAQADERESWPSSVIEQIQALQRVIAKGPRSVEGTASQFKGARRELVERHLETLALMGEVQKTPEGLYQWTTPIAA